MIATDKSAGYFLIVDIDVLTPCEKKGSLRYD